MSERNTEGRSRSKVSLLAISLLWLLASIAQSVHAQTNADDYLVYFGTYTSGKSKGIHAWRFQPSTGKLSPIGLVAETPNPAFLAVSPNNKLLYAVNWKGSDTVPGDTVSGYSIDSGTGKLTFLNKVASQGEMPTNLMVDATGQALVVVNYGTGSVAAFHIGPGGRLSEASAVDRHRGAGQNPRQEGPHAHGVAFSPDNRFAFVADLGLDRVFSYRFDAARAFLSPDDPASVTVAPGSGPRHLAVHPNGKYLYVCSELRPTVFVFEVSGGKLRQIQELPAVPADYRGAAAPAEVQTDRAGRFLYVSNRGHDSIAVFAIDNSTGTLKPVEHVSTQGKMPRNFSLDPTGAYLFAANQNSDTVVVFRVDPGTGRLTQTGQVLNIPNPVCVLFVKAR